MSFLSGRFSHLLALGIIVFSLLACYSGSLDGEYIFDDLGSIVENESIRSIGASFGGQKNAIEGETVAGRPLLNFSFALNYAVHALDIRYYRLTNIFLHGLNGILLFGVLQRIVCRLKPDSLPQERTVLSLTVLVFWLCHPVHVNSVTNVVQRAELLGAFFVLLITFLGIKLIDRCESKGYGRQSTFAGCGIACLTLLGSLAKETVIVAPAIILIYHLVLVDYKWRKSALGLYLTQFVAIGLVLMMHVIIEGRGGSAGSAEVSVIGRYWMVQTWAMFLYVKTIVIPTSIGLDYGDSLFLKSSQIVLGLSGVVLGLVLTAWIVIGRKKWMLFGLLSYLALLSPTMLVPVLTQTIAIHRVYLASLFVLCLLVFLLMRLPYKPIQWSICILLVLGLIWQTRTRNRTFQSAEKVLLESIEAAPDNWRNYSNLATYYGDRNVSIEKIMPYVNRAIELNPTKPKPRYNKANFLYRRGMYRESLELLQGLQDHDSQEIFHLIGLNYWRLGQLNEAMDAFNRSLQIKSDYVLALTFRANVFLDMQRSDLALKDILSAIEAADPIRGNGIVGETYNTLGIIYVRMKKYELAYKAYDEGINLFPDYVHCYTNRGVLNYNRQAYQAAGRDFQKAMSLEPNNQEHVKRYDLVRSLLGE